MNDLPDDKRRVYAARVVTKRGEHWSRPYTNEIAAKGQATQIRSELDNVLYSEVVSYLAVTSFKWPERL